MIDVSADLDFGALLIIKVGLIAFLIIYSIFALIVVKQVDIMADTLEVGFERPIRAISIIHFFASVLTLFIAFAVL